MTWTWPTPQNVKQPYLYLKFRQGTVPHTPPPTPPKSLSSCLMTYRVYPVCLLDNPIKGSTFCHVQVTVETQCGQWKYFRKSKSRHPIQVNRAASVII